MKAARLKRRSDFRKAMAYMLNRQDGLRLPMGDDRVDIDPNFVKNAIRSSARIASLIASCKLNEVEAEHAAAGWTSLRAR